MTARGCGSAALFGVAFLLVGISFAFTVEMEDFPGLRPNESDLALYCAASSAGAGLGALLLGGRRSLPVLAVTALLAATLAWRIHALAPALDCWGHDTVGRNADGSYDCFDL
ncbi:hypothetical protein [Streptomyces pristinaespiralis]|uniref:hypothetical protein n=1 Tax=Streptomyces pristinaespiralis TaxID=38300 RepID=UPI0033C0048E